MNSLDSPQQSKIRKFNSTHRLIAAGIFIALMFCAFLLLKKVPTSPDQLFDRYFETYALTTSAGQSEDPVRMALHAAYSAQEYRAAISAFDQLTDVTDLDHLLMANSYMAIGRPAGGLSSLTKVIEGKSSLRPEARWYLALTYVKLNDLTSAGVLAQAVVESDPARASKARKLFDELQRNNASLLN